jgi:deoxycytidylate deaminase
VTTNFDWGELAFGSKKPLRELNATFIAAPREMSAARLTQLVKQYLPEGNIILGLAKESHVSGLEGQPQFGMLQATAVQPLTDKIAASASKHKLYTLQYFQRETAYILEKVRFRRVLLVNGSWHHSFHLSPVYYTLANQRIDYELVSPFTDEAEARAFEHAADSAIQKSLPAIPQTAISDIAMLQLANDIAKQSYDHTHQTGVVLGKKRASGKGNGYAFLTSAYNKVVPFQTYAMLHGSLREQHFSPPNDLNFYDTNHAETMLLINAVKQGMSLAGATVFINLLPCPTCGRMLAETDISEVVYHLDHSNGYTLGILEAAGKHVRRISI